MTDRYNMTARREGKTRAAVEGTKAAQKRGQRVLWVTTNQTSTAALLARHGALSEVIGDSYLAPKFKSNK